VRKAEVDFGAGLATVTYAEGRVTVEQMIAALGQWWYSATVLPER